MSNEEIYVVSRGLNELEFDDKDYLYFCREEDAQIVVQKNAGYHLRTDIMNNIFNLYDVINELNKYKNDKVKLKNLIDQYKNKYVYYTLNSNKRDIINKIYAGVILNIVTEREKGMVCATGNGRCYCSEKNIDNINCPHLYEDDYCANDISENIITISDINRGGCLDFTLRDYGSVDFYSIAKDDSDLLIYEVNKNEIIDKVIDYIYFIQEPITKSIKIGTTKNVKNRFKQLQTSSPLQLKLLKTTKGNIDEEKKLHDQFAIYRLSGEWFQENDELMKYIDMIK